MTGRRLVALRSAALLLLLVGCQAEDPLGGPAPTLARGGSTADPTVAAVDPAFTEQGTTLDVRVTGSGYDRGSTVRMEVDGAAVPKIITNSTRYVSSKELVANITVAADAEARLYDVAVTTAGGRKGIGTEKFEVKIVGWTDLDSRATVYLYRTLADGETSTRLYGDGRGVDGSASPVPDESAYPGETCGVRGKLFNSVTASNSGDLVFDPAFDTDRSACGRRSIRAEFVTGSPVVLTPFTNARQLWQMTPGATKVQDMGWGNGGALPCGSRSVSLKYEQAQGSGTQVTRLADQGGARVWRVESTGNHQASCYKTSGGTATLASLHYLPFHLVIVENPAPAGGW